MAIAVGDALPQVVLTTVVDGAPAPVSTTDFFAGRRVALFAVPGAYTPTCSARHLPGFVERAAELRTHGIDAIACTAVNDIFVLAGWIVASEAGGTIEPLADGNASFADALGLAIDLSAFGMGVRSRRYAMIVDGGQVAWLGLDQPGEFGESSADQLVSALIDRA